MSDRLTARLASRAPLAPGVQDLVFAMTSPEKLAFRAGQFVSIAVGADAQGSPIRRSYSIASPSSRGDVVRLIVRIIPGGAASTFFEGLTIGESVQMTGPHGFFVLDREHAGDLVFGATGTGIAPVASMLAELAERSDGGRRVVYWGLRREEDLFALGEIEHGCRLARASLQVFLSRPADSWMAGRGRITPAVLAALPDLVSPTFYLAGNGAMIGELKKELVARGMSRKKQIRTEAFFD